MSSDTVLKRIFDAQGSDYIEQHWYNAYLRAKDGTLPDFDEFENDIWPNLVRCAVKTADTPDCLDIYVQYCILAKELLECKLHTGQKMQNYPVMSVRNGADSLKLQLHQIPYHISTNWLDIGMEKAVFAHSCHRANCIIHAWPTTRQNNTAQTYCKAFQLVGNRLHKVCQCKPQQCIQSGSLAYFTSQ